MKPQRIQYRIMECGGEEPGYEASELININSQQGWQSPRFCYFPLELIIQFPSIINIEYIQILSHQFKIPQFIDILVGQPQMGFAELGSVEFDNNIRQNFQVKELKTVQIGRSSLFIKLVIHKNHINKLNIFNQVGIMMLQIYGYPVSDSQLKNIKPTKQNSLQNKMNELLSLKERAIQIEDFKEAKRIKTLLDRILHVKQALEHLEVQKKQAVSREDFETAQLFKQEIQKINENFDGFLQQDNEFKKNDETNLQLLSNRSQLMNNQNSFFQNQQNDQSFNQLNLSNIVEQSFDKKRFKHDEQVVPALKNKIDDQHNSYSSQDHLLQDEELNYEIQPEDQKIIDQFQQVFTKEPLIQILNKVKWQDRVDGLKFIDKEILNPTVIDKKDENLYSLGITYLAMLSFRDKINQVTNQGISMFKSFLTTEKDIKSSKGDIQSNIDQIFEILLEKLSDFNIKEQLSQLFLIMSQNQMIHVNYCLNSLVKYKKLKSPRNLVSRIDTILLIIQNAEQNIISDQVFQMILEFTIFNLKDNNQEVRKSSFNLIIQLYKMNPQKIKDTDKQIPLSLGVQQKIDQIDGKEYKCDYCLLVNKDFSDQKKLAQHHKNVCFMLTNCKACGQQIEIQNYNKHLVQICKKKKDFQQCPKCDQSIVKIGYDAHLKVGCEAGTSKCPICQSNIENDQDGLRDHLTQNKCGKNKKLSLHI